MDTLNDKDVKGRARLMDAAFELFRDSAYREISVKDITSRSKVAAPSLYHHFGDKEGLYVAWAEVALSRLGESVVAELGDISNTRDQLAAISRAILMNTHLNLLVVLRDAKMMAKPESQERIMHAYLAGVFEPLVGVLVRGVERGKLRPEPIARMANAFLLGAVSMSQAFSMESATVEDASVWWAKRFVNGFGA